MTVVELPTADTEPIPVDNVVWALARVMAELPGIGKDSQSPQGYSYRGIEQVTKEAQRLFAKHGVVIAPHRVKWYPPREFLIRNNPWTDERCRVTFRVYGPGGARDYIEVTTVGIGRDNSDKGSNKAYTQAFKYALLETLMISDAKDDLEDAPASERTPPEGWASWDECDRAHAELSTDVKATSDEARRKWQGYLRASGYSKPFTKPQLEDLAGELLIIANDGAHRVASVGPVEASQPSPPGPASSGSEVAPDESAGMVSEENSEQPSPQAHETPAEIAGTDGSPPLPLPSVPRVDVKEWLRVHDDEARARYDAYRRKKRIGANPTAWTPEQIRLVGEWCAAYDGGDRSEP